jgi:phenylacetate-CoA ligase
MANIFRTLYLLILARRRLHWDADRLRKHQEKMLRSVVRYAYDSVPFYHEKFKRCGIKPENIKTLEDLAKIPVVRKDEFRQQSSDRLVSRNISLSKLRKLKTSGSTGRPLEVLISGYEDDWRKAIYMRANLFCGQKPRDKWVVIAGPAHRGDTTKIQQILGIYARKHISVFEKPAVQAQLVKKFHPDILDGYSSALYLLAKELEKIGCEGVKPKMIFGNADVIDDLSRDFIEKMFDAPFYDQYGCVEFNRTAWQCPEKIGYHMDVDSVFTQFVDENGEEVSAGERGRIVQTSLFNYAMPFIRYEVGDVGVFLEEKCPCGIVLPLMKEIEGREDSFIVLPDGQVLSPRNFTVAMSMFRFYSFIEQFQIMQKRVDFFEVYLKMRKSNVDNNIVRSELVDHFVRILNLKGINVDFNVNFVDEIPLSKSGKLMAVVSEVNRFY